MIDSVVLPIAQTFPAADPTTVVGMMAVAVSTLSGVAAVLFRRILADRDRHSAEVKALNDLRIADKDAHIARLDRIIDAQTPALQNITAAVTILTKEFERFSEHPPARRART